MSPTINNLPHQFHSTVWGSRPARTEPTPLEASTRKTCRLQSQASWREPPQTPQTSLPGSKWWQSIGRPLAHGGITGALNIEAHDRQSSCENIQQWTDLWSQAMTLERITWACCSPCGWFFRAEQAFPDVLDNFEISPLPRSERKLSVACASHRQCWGYS